MVIAWNRCAVGALLSGLAVFAAGSAQACTILPAYPSYFELPVQTAEEKVAGRKVYFADLIPVLAKSEFIVIGEIESIDFRATPAEQAWADTLQYAWARRLAVRVTRSIKGDLTGLVTVFDGWGSGCDPFPALAAGDTVLGLFTDLDGRLVSHDIAEAYAHLDLQTISPLSNGDSIIAEAEISLVLEALGYEPRLP